MSKARDLANFVSTGNPLADGTLAVADITDLTASAAELNLLDGSAAATVANSKAVIYGASGEVFAAQVDITATGDLRLQDTTGGEYVALQAPGTVSASYTLTLPAANGTNGQFLQTDGSGALSFVSLPASQSIVRVTRTSNTALTTSNLGNLIDITSGTFTQTFDPAATLGSGWYCYIRNIGTGDITLDPNSSETIDGLTTFIMYPGEARLIQCDGSNFFSVVLASFTKTFTTTDTFYKPPGYAVFSGLLWGAGGGGGKRNSSSYFAGGGGGGGCHPFTLASSFFSTTETVTIGAGGAGATTDGGDGAGGGDTSIGSLFTGYGGGGGKSGTGTTNSGSGGGGGGALSAGSLGSQNSTGANGGKPWASSGPNSVYGGGVGYGGNSILSNNDSSAYWGGGAGAHTAGGPQELQNSFWGGGGGGSSRFGVAGGTSTHGGNGGKGEDGATSGGDGVAPGGGGGATRTGTKAGDGARGEARIWGIV